MEDVVQGFVVGLTLGAFGMMWFMFWLQGPEHHTKPADVDYAVGVCAQNGGFKEFSDHVVWCANGAEFKR